MVFIFSFFISLLHAQHELHWIKIPAANKYERSKIANTGAVIEVIKDDYVIAIGTKEEKKKLQTLGLVDESFLINEKNFFDFPANDSLFHNYQETLDEMESIQQEFPEIVSLEQIGTSIEGRSIYNIRISTDLDTSNQKPGIVFMGTHHAREHLSTETPLKLARYLASNFSKDPRIKKLITGREIHIIPMVNPDGVEHDISGSRYKSWRKNRRNNGNGTYGVDLNRNYGYQWGTGGSSASTNSDVYKGPQAFSEPETLAIKNFIENRENISILLSFHTFSELILYPWGHTYDSIQDSRSFQVHKVMAETMAKWNQYTPQQSSDLYIASGDTTDWSYGEHGIISFTFELDPSSIWSGGFYPGQRYIQTVFEKNLEPCLYLIDLADNPYRVLESKAERLGFKYDIF